MDKRKDKIQTSEFEQKLQESIREDKRLEDFREEHHRDTRHYDESRPDAPHLEANTESETIPVVEETVRVGKEIVETGKVRISKRVHESEVDVELPTVHEEIDVQRVPVNMPVEDTPPPVRYEGDVMIIPVLREEVVVQKRLVVVEELHVTRKRTQTNETERIVLRKEEVNVDRVDNTNHNPR
ncbi:YsnF/AvaK domain-containing protein [Pontibacter akesuensis]|uniref:Conserved domain-containing protein n=1 Tax=Pontibacter akesuensis TaxID=388950 RepID=A0A1I7G9S4_9BACT|nr:YsnF/AvaK domain-containing protein [Pontibacter akesuensis]GHA57886.1 hypothetical protein GCM10007389_07170 [Pontibacter akesuensis]SFU45187.1 conserved domain-containing protein [Pontibacter akesuensis]